MAEKIQNKLKSTKQIMNESQGVAGQAANAAAGQAAQQARAGMKEGGQSRLAGALAGAQARSNAAATGFNNALSTASSLTAAQNAKEQDMASQQAQMDEQRKQYDKDRGDNWIKTGLSFAGSLFSDEQIKRYKSRIFK